MLSIRGVKRVWDEMKRMRAETDAAVKEALARNDARQAIALNHLASSRVEEIRRACDDFLSHLYMQRDAIENSR